MRDAVNWALVEQVVEDILFDNSSTCSVVGDLIAHYIEEKGEVYLNKSYIAYAKSILL